MQNSFRKAYLCVVGLPRENCYPSALHGIFPKEAQIGGLESSGYKLANTNFLSVIVVVISTDIVERVNDPPCFLIDRSL